MASQTSSILSSATFAKLSPHPYLLANLQPADSSTASSRTNGRQPQQSRQPNINASSLTHAHGSSVVRTGDTTVICGVRAETILTTDIPNYRAPDNHSTAKTNELRDYDLLVPNIELATGCSPNFLPGVPPTTLAQTLSTRIYSLLHSSGLLDVEDLRIYSDRQPLLPDVSNGDTLQREIKAYWVLYIDVLFISFDGNPFDAAWASIVTALRDTRLPPAHWDPDAEMVLCFRGGSHLLSIRGLPVACTAAVFTAKEKREKGGGQTWVLVDPDRLEESLCNETITLVVDRSKGDTRLVAISKSGGTTVGPAVVSKLVKVAEARWQEFKEAVG
ncbi:ribosomal protein S5 domain 2-like protein [Xylariomycetidae sp. FL2044]|nr:ribosomal protein S5 domain 2-like protein [Xylariomycetidae sp. FL2044]